MLHEILNVVAELGSFIGVGVVTLGVIGGLLSLPKQYRDFKRDRAQHGNKGVGYQVLEKIETSEMISVRFLVVEDVMHFIRNFSNEEFGGIAKHVAQVGQYYEVEMVFPPDANLNFIITRRRKAA
jgi:hypothetical protein